MGERTVRIREVRGFDPTSSPPKEKSPPHGGDFSFGILGGDSNGSGVRKRAGGIAVPRRRGRMKRRRNFRSRAALRL